MPPPKPGRPARSAGRRALPKSDETRQRIIAAAAHVLAERGYAGTKLSDIAERAGMQAGSLYYHFEDRDDLVDHVLREGAPATHQRVREAVDSLPGDASHRQKLETAITTHLTVLLEIGDVGAASLRLLGQLPPETQRRYRRYQQTYGQYWHELIVAAQNDGAIRADLDPVSVRLFIIGALNWVVEWPASARRPVTELAETVVAMTLDGLGMPDRRCRA